MYDIHDLSSFLSRHYRDNSSRCHAPLPQDGGQDQSSILAGLASLLPLQPSSPRYIQLFDICDPKEPADKNIQMCNIQHLWDFH